MKITYLVRIAFLGLVASGWGWIQVHAAVPQLFFSDQDVAAIRSKTLAAPWMGQAAAAIVRRADELMDTPTAPYPLTSPYNAMGTAGRAVQARVGLIAFAGYLKNDPAYFKKAKEILLAVCRQTEPDNPKDWQAHLQYSDAAQGVAIGYDWLAPYMTEAERKEVRAMIWKFGHLLYTDHVAWGLPDPSLSSCNHNAVQFGALGLCALVLGDQPAWRDRAIDQIRRYLKYSMDDTGYITEGHLYMAYGFQGALPFAYALRRAGGPDLVAEQPHFAETTDQILWKLLPESAALLAMNDAEEDAGCAGMLTYPIFRFHQSAGLWAWLRLEGESGAGTYGVGHKKYLGDGLSAPFALIWGDPALKPQSPTEAGTPLGHRFSSGRVFLRSGWDSKNDAHVALTSGLDFHQGHNHQDENAVTLHALGEAFLIDPTYFCSETRCHNTMLIGGAGQVSGSHGRVVAYREDKFGAFMCGEAPEAYDRSKVLVGHFARKIYFVRQPTPYLIWRDDAQLDDDRAVEYTELFHTAPQNRMEIGSDGTIRIRGSNTGAKCLIEAVHSAAPSASAETDLGQAGTGRYGLSFLYKKYFREATIKSTARNPHFIVLAFPYRKESEIPQVTVTGPEEKLTCVLQFPDGRKDAITLTDADVSFERIGTDSQ